MKKSCKEVIERKPEAKSERATAINFSFSLSSFLQRLQSHLPVPQF